MRCTKQSNSEHLVVSLPTKCSRTECATPVSKTKQNDLACVVEAMNVMTQDLSYWDFDPRERPSELGVCDNQVVMKALLSRDAGQQIDLADHQVTPPGLVQAVPVVPCESGSLM